MTMSKVKKADILFNEVDGLYVVLYIGEKFFGTVSMKGYNISYAHDAVFNWEKGILTEDNPHIEKYHYV